MLANFFSDTLICFPLKLNLIFGNDIARLKSRWYMRLWCVWSISARPNLSRSGSKYTSTPALPEDCLTFPGFISDMLLKHFIVCCFLPSSEVAMKVFEKMFAATEPNPLVPIFSRSSLNDVPDLSVVHAISGRVRSSLLLSSFLTGIPIPLSVTVTDLLSTFTWIFVAALKSVSIATSIELSIISFMIFMRPGTT